MLTAEQVVAAHKANVETLFGLTGKAFEGVEKLVELNLQVAKAALGEVAENARAALSVKDAQELLALQASMLQPAAEKAASYSAICTTSPLRPRPNSARSPRPSSPTPRRTWPRPSSPR